MLKNSMKHYWKNKEMVVIFTNYLTKTSKKLSITFQKLPNLFVMDTMIFYKVITIYVLNGVVLIFALGIKEAIKLTLKDSVH